MSIAHLCIAYKKFADEYYRKNGKVTSEVCALKLVPKAAVPGLWQNAAFGIRPRRTQRVQAISDRPGL